MQSPTKQRTDDEPRATLSVSRSDYRVFKRMAAKAGRTLTGQFAVLMRLAKEQEARNGK